MDNTLPPEPSAFAKEIARWLIVLSILLNLGFAAEHIWLMAEITLHSPPVLEACPTVRPTRPNIP